MNNNKILAWRLDRSACQKGSTGAAINFDSSYPYAVFKFTRLMKRNKLTSIFNVADNICKINGGFLSFNELVDNGFMLEGGIGKEYAEKIKEKTYVTVDGKDGNYTLIVTEAVPILNDNMVHLQQQPDVSNQFTPKRCDPNKSQYDIGPHVRYFSNVEDSDGRKYFSEPIVDVPVDVLQSTMVHCKNNIDYPPRRLNTDRYFLQKSIDQVSDELFDIHICGGLDLESIFPWNPNKQPILKVSNEKQGVFKSIKYEAPNENKKQGLITAEILLTSEDDCNYIIEYFNDNPKQITETLKVVLLEFICVGSVGKMYSDLIYGDKNTKKGKYSEFYSSINGFAKLFDVSITKNEDTINDCFSEYIKDKIKINTQQSFLFEEATEKKDVVEHFFNNTKPLYFEYTNSVPTHVYVLDPSYYDNSFNSYTIQEIIRLLCRDKTQRVQIDNYYDTCESFKGEMHYSYIDCVNDTWYENTTISDDIDRKSIVKTARYFKVKIINWSLGLYALFMRMTGTLPGDTIDKNLYGYTNYITWKHFQDMNSGLQIKNNPEFFAKTLRNICSSENPSDVSYFPSTYGYYLSSVNDAMKEPVILSKKSIINIDNKDINELGICRCANSIISDPVRTRTSELDSMCFAEGCVDFSTIFTDEICGDKNRCEQAKSFLTDLDCQRRSDYIRNNFNQNRYDRLCGKDFPIVFKKKNQRIIEMVTIILCVSLSLLILLLVKGNWIVKGVIAGGTVTILVLISKIIIRSIKTDDCGNPIEPAQ